MNTSIVKCQSIYDMQYDSIRTPSEEENISQIILTLICNTTVQYYE
jgi:hypothetical protein